MTHTFAGILMFQEFSIWGVMLFAIVGFSLGFILRLAVNAKQKRKLLRLEDEMLKNHSHILALEKKINILERENDELANNDSKKAKLKVS